MRIGVSKTWNDQNFDLFWQLVQSTKEQLDVNEAILHRPRKRPRRYKDGLGEPVTFDSPMVYYRSMYYQSIDAAVTTIQDCFHKQDYSLYSTLEKLLMKATSSGDYVLEKLTTHEQFQSLPVSQISL